MIESVPPFVYLAVAAFAVAVLPRLPGHIVAGLATAAIGIQGYLLSDGTHVETMFLGFEVVFLNVDGAARLFAVGIGILATAAVLYAYESGASRVMTAFALTYVASTAGVVFAGDWLSMIFFWELMAVTSTLLVWHYRGAAVRAGYRYAIFHGIGGTILLGAVIVHFVSVGPASDAFLYSATEGIYGAAAGPLGSAAAFLAAIGIGVNCGFIFLHSWIPDTYPRPHVAASVFLSVFTTKTAVFIMFRAFPDGGLWLAYLGGTMAVYGVFFALLQYDPRRLLSYHIQAQVGYMLAGIGLAAMAGDYGGGFAAAGGLAHAFNNILYKALLFMAVGVVIYRTGKQNIKKMGGLWKVMPLTFLAYLIGAASITAVPGTNGFVSKGMVLDSAHSVNEFPLLLGEDLLWWLLILGAIGTFMSFIKLGYYIFFHGEATIQPRDATPGQTVAMLFVGAFCVIFGFAHATFFELLPFTESVTATAKPFSTGHLTEGIILLVVGFVAFFGLKGPITRIAWLPDVDRVLFPAAFYTGRVLVWGVTELWAAVDRAVMATAGASMRVGTEPGRYAYHTAARVPGVDVETLPAGNDEETIQLRASSGFSIFLVTLALFVGLAILLVL